MTQADAKSKSIVSDNSELDPNTVSDFQDQEQLQSAVPELRQPLLPGHRLGLCAIQTSYFSGNLRDGAASTTPGRYTIPSEPSVYALLLADLLTILGDKPDIGQRNEEDEGTHKAIISNCFRIFAMNVAWNKIRQKTHFDVMKALIINGKYNEGKGWCTDNWTRECSKIEDISELFSLHYINHHRYIYLHIVFS